MGSNPSLIQIKYELQRYDSIEQEIDDIKPIIVLGLTELSTGKVTVICYRQEPGEVIFSFIHCFLVSYLTVHNISQCLGEIPLPKWREIVSFAAQTQKEISQNPKK